MAQKHGGPGSDTPGPTDNNEPTEPSVGDPADIERAYTAGFRDGWTDRGVYEQRPRHAGDDYLPGYADGQAAAGGIVNLATVTRG